MGAIKTNDGQKIRNAAAKPVRMGADAEHDPVNHPAHYTRGGIECIDAIQAAVDGLNGPEAWMTGSIIKYVWRWAWKNGSEDLRKARFYLDRLISIVQQKEDREEQARVAAKEEQASIEEKNRLEVMREEAMIRQQELAEQNRLVGMIRQSLNYQVRKAINEQSESKRRNDKGGPNEW